MGSLGVVEVQPAADSVFSGAGLTEVPGVEAFLVQGAVDTLHLTVLLGHTHGDELVANPPLAQGLFEGVGLLHVGEEDIGELHAVVGLHFLDGEGVGPQHAFQEESGGLWGEFLRDPGHLWRRVQSSMAV